MAVGKGTKKGGNRLGDEKGESRKRDSEWVMGEIPVA